MNRPPSFWIRKQISPLVFLTDPVFSSNCSYIQWRLYVIKVLHCCQDAQFPTLKCYIRPVYKLAVYPAYLSSSRSKVLVVFSMEFFVFLDSESTWVNNFAVFNVSSCTWDDLERAFITCSQSSSVLLVLRWHSSLEAKNCCWSSWIELARELLPPVDSHRLFCISIFFYKRRTKTIRVNLNFWGRKKKDTTDKKKNLTPHW